MIHVAILFIQLFPSVALLAIDGWDKREGHAPAIPEKTKVSRYTEYYKGETDAEWLQTTIRSMHHRIANCDAIIVATPGASRATEGRIVSFYIIQRILKGREFLQAYIKKKDLGVGFGEQTYVLVEYRKFDVPTSRYAQTAPDGLTILFLDDPKTGSEHLSIRGEMVYDGMIYATKEMVELLEDAVSRLDKILTYFKENGFRLKKQTGDGSCYVIDETEDGAYARTAFCVFPATRDHHEIRQFLQMSQGPKIYNPYCKIAISYPGVVGPPNTPELEAPGPPDETHREGFTVHEVGQRVSPDVTAISARPSHTRRTSP